MRYVKYRKKFILSTSGYLKEHNLLQNTLSRFQQSHAFLSFFLLPNIQTVSFSVWNAFILISLFPFIQILFNTQYQLKHLKKLILRNEKYFYKYHVVQLLYSACTLSTISRLHDLHINITKDGELTWWQICIS